MNDERLTHKKIGLALGSGGPRGLAHIGVIKALEEHQIPIDIIAGSSAGALIGGLYAAFGSIEKVEEIAKTVTFKDIAIMFSDIGTLAGIIRGNNIEKFLDTLLTGRTIESLPMPYAAVATDIHTGNPVEITHGSLARAIRASSSIPAFIESILLEGHYLTDGGGSYPVPVPTTKKLGADYIIAVNLDGLRTQKANDIEKKVPVITDMGITAVSLLRYNLARELCHDADVMITPDVASILSINVALFVHGEDIIKKGYDATIAAIEQIKKTI